MTRNILAALLLLSACGESANLSVEEGMGPDPKLPEPTKTLFPTVNTAEVGGWAEGEMPTPAPGFTVTEYAADLDHPRWLYRLPNGDMLVAETNKPPQAPSGIKGWIESTIMSNAGAGVESPNRITLLRDALGSDLVPDYMTSVKEGGFYGWPYSYYGQNVDDRPEPQRPDLVERAIVPDYALGPHTASLGLAFTPAGGGAVVGQHGSWNREPRSGYQVVYVPFDGAEPSGKPQVLLGGFLVGDTAKGRPVGVTFDRAGALLVADDVGNRIWRVTPAG